MRFAIVGSGGVGGYFGARLEQGGHEVAFLARGAHLATMRRDGLSVRSVAGDYTVSNPRAADDPTMLGEADVVLVAVKTWQLEAIMPEIPPLLGKDTVVLPLLNGVEATGELARHLGAERVLTGLCGIFAFIEAPGVIQHQGVDPFIRLGEPDNGQSERVARIADILDAAPGMKAEVPDDIRVALWEKFLFVAPSGTVGAACRAPFGVMRTLAEVRALIRSAMEEIRDVGQELGVALDDGVVAKGLNGLDNAPAEGTASMQRDIMEGRRSELEAQPGAVVRLAERTGVSTPVNRMLYHLLLPQERRARGEIVF